ncbi:MAG TPA: hypothetical protein ENK18_06705, partial [Deltaproteobacteria bacterium]|nr:hypothetical protein [Deltaproteobacteria bacterium]
VVGRQEVTLHEQRLVGPVGWTQQGRSFDGAFASVSRGNLSADVGGAVLTSVNADPTGYDSFFGMIRAGVSGEGSTLDLVYLPLSDASRDRLTHTAGVYTKGSSGPLQGRAEVYLQAGTRDGQSEMAWLAGLSGTLAPEVSGDPKVTLWYDYLSGDGDPGDGRATAFDTLFATNHKFYGLIDVMAFSVGGVGDGQGLQDAALKLSVAPDAAIRTHLDAHLFLPSVGENAMLGQEVDLWGRWKVTEGLGLSGGGAALLRSDAQADLWSFLQLDANL